MSVAECAECECGCMQREGVKGGSEVVRVHSPSTPLMHLECGCMQRRGVKVRECAVCGSRVGVLAHRPPTHLEELGEVHHEC